MADSEGVGRALLMDAARVVARLPHEGRQPVARSWTAVHCGDRTARFRVVVDHCDDDDDDDDHNEDRMGIRGSLTAKSLKSIKELTKKQVL